MRKLRSRLTYANVTATLALMIAVAGGTAYAADTIGSSDVIDNSLLSADLKNNQAVKSADVVNENLTGADIADNSGVNTCPSPLTVQLGRICAGSDGTTRVWFSAVGYCAELDLRLPSLSEALTMARNYDVPGVSASEDFWTDEELYVDGTYLVEGVSDAGNEALIAQDDSIKTVCVTTPTN
jgi:hypothetical protein